MTKRCYGARLIIRKPSVASRDIAGSDKVADSDREVNGFGRLQFDLYAGETLLDKTVGITSISGEAVAIVALFWRKANAITADRKTNTIGALRFAFTKWCAAVANFDILVVALFGSLNKTIATIGCKARIPRHRAMRALFQIALRITSICGVGIAVVAKLKARDKAITTRGRDAGGSCNRATPARFNLACVAAPVFRIGISVVAGFISLDAPISANDDLHAFLAFCWANERIFQGTRRAASIGIGSIAIIAFFIGCFDSVTTALRNSPIKNTAIGVVGSAVCAITFW
tara:strand:- start:8405 stop:9265 length:861 start_codon:yes stop_codon:yes gene_type:complete